MGDRALALNVEDETFARLEALARETGRSRAGFRPRPSADGRPGSRDFAGCPVVPRLAAGSRSAGLSITESSRAAFGVPRGRQLSGVRRSSMSTRSALASPASARVEPGFLPVSISDR
jgi:hypothetical protein